MDWESAPQQLKRARFFQQLTNQLHSLSLFSAGTELCDRALYSPCPIQVRLCPGDVEAVFAREQIGDHDHGNPGVTSEKRVHHRGIKIFLVIELVDFGIQSGEKGDLLECRSRLLPCLGVSEAQELLPTKRESVRDRASRTSQRKAARIVSPGMIIPSRISHCGILNPAMPSDCRLGRT